MSIKKNTVYNTILSILNLIFPIITAPYISRVFEVSSIGMVSFVVTYTAYYVIFAVLSTPFYGIREIAKNIYDNKACNRVFSEIFFLTVLASIFCSICYIISIYTIDKLYVDRVFLWVSGITLLLSPLNIDWYFIGKENVRYITIRSIFIRVISLIALFVFVRSADDVMNYMLISVFGTIGAGIWSFGYALKRDLKITIKGINLQRRFSLMMPLFVSSVAVSVYTLLDTLMLGFLTSDSEVGYYSQSFRLTRIILFLTIAISPIIVARINQYRGTKEYEKIKPLLTKSFYLILILTLPLSLGLIVIAPRFVPFFLSDQFIPSILPMQILSLLVIVIGLAYVFKVQVLSAMEKDKIALYLAVGTALANVVANFILIPKYGASGAAIASVLAEVLGLFVGIYISQKVIKLHFKLTEVLKPIVAVSLFVPLSIFISSFVESNLWYIIITIFSCACSYIAILLLTRSTMALYLRGLMLDFIKTKSFRSL